MYTHESTQEHSGMHMQQTCVNVLVNKSPVATPIGVFRLEGLPFLILFLLSMTSSEIVSVIKQLAGLLIVNIA